MKGNPKHINSRADYMYIKENCEPEFWKPIWKSLLDTQYYWAPTEIFDKKEQCKVDDMHKYEIIDPVNTKGAIKYQQYELKENPNCDMIKFGFTRKEIEDAIK